uniref:Uncharacterized protein n=1 Tax=Arundo donax TaxID=35708 RepID=A0A0A9BN40_ARUDO
MLGVSSTRPFGPSKTAVCFFLFL